MRNCSKCKHEKQNSEFNKHARGKDGLHSWCKGCIREYKTANKERFAEYARRSRQENPELFADRYRKYAKENSVSLAAHKRQYRLANSEKIAERARESRLANPEKYAAKDRNRRAIKKRAAGTHTAADVRSIFDSQRGLCASCEASLFKTGSKRFHVDHIQPLILGGSNDRFNLQCLCPTCNLRKNAKDPIKWANENGKLI